MTAGEFFLEASSGGLKTTSVRIAGDVFGFTTPVPPEFTTREIRESNKAIMAPNTLQVQLVANFDLQSVEGTVITLFGLVSPTPDNPKLPIMRAGSVPAEYVQPCGTR